jgi:arylsulfatase A-like enzyme
MLSAIDPWLGKIFELINLENTLCVITSDHGSISADFTKEMSDFCIDLENERTKKNQTVLDSKNIHKITTKWPKRFEKLRKNISKYLIKTRDKKTGKFLESRINLEKDLHLSLYHERLLKKSWLEPKECFDESFRPTLIFLGYKIPQEKIISKQISTLDIFPTILKLLGVDVSIRHHGESLLELINNGEYKKKIVMIDGASDDSKAKQGDTIGLRTEEYKYFRDRNSEKSNYHLYDLKEDPLELNNVFEENEDIVKKFEEELKKINPTGNFEFKRSEKFTSKEDIEIEEELKKMGYI